MKEDSKPRCSSGIVKGQAVVEGRERAVVYFGEESEICSGREINPMGRFEFGHVGCPVAVVC